MSRVGPADPVRRSHLAHPFGGDSLGRDILSRLMIGAQVSLIVGLGTQVLVIAVGVVIGPVAGYFRGVVDGLLSLVINIFYGIPDLLVALILVVLLGSRGLLPIIIAISATRWMDMARLVRGQALSIREREYVEAARASGARPHRILFGHILPNALGPIIVQATSASPPSSSRPSSASSGSGWRRRHRRSGDRWPPRGPRHPVGAPYRPGALDRAVGRAAWRSIPRRRASRRA